MYFYLLFFYEAIPTEQAVKKPKWLFNLRTGISIGSCRKGKIKLTLPTAIFIAVGNSIFFL